MYYFEIGLFLIGIVLLVVGYRKNSRNVLVVACVMLFLAGTLGDFLDGFSRGFSDGFK